MNNNLDNVNNQEANDIGDNIDPQNVYMYVRRFRPIITSIWRLSGIYIIWIFIHFYATHLYAKYCTSYSILGFLATPIIISSPHCTGLRWCIMRGADTINTMWIVLGTWLATQLGGFRIN